jgi:group I intron endonuclease
MKSGIYLIKNITNNKVYIGSAINIPKRWSQHKKLLKEGKHHSKHLQSAWNIYGEQSFIFEIIEQVLNADHLISYEQVYLDYYKSYEDEKGYNIYKTAGSPYGIKRSEETKKKMSQAKTGIKHSEEHKRKIREAKTGIKHSEETKKKMSEAARNMSEETKKKMSEANRNSKKYKYYSFNKDKKKYRVIIWRKEIGYYDTEEEAKQAVIINLEKLKVQQIV